MADRIITEFIKAAKDRLDKYAHDAMTLPKPDQFNHGVTVGQYQGLKEALYILEAVLSEEE